MGRDLPFLYTVEKYDASFPSAPFDPKAVTRASFAEKPPPPKHDGPLLYQTQRLDSAHNQQRRNTTRRYALMSARTKSWIIGLRRLQLLLRMLQLISAIGILVLAILISNLEQTTAWMLRITAGVAALHAVYGIYHLSRPATGRAPASSAAYQLFSAISDLAAVPLFAFGAVIIHAVGHGWKSLLSGPNMGNKVASVLYYNLITSGGLHVTSLAICIWLGWMFRKISLMPPDMNPLESNLTSRLKHKKNKSSVASASTTTTTASSSSSSSSAAPSKNVLRTLTPLEQRRRSGAPYENLSRAPSIPFSHSQPHSTRSSRFSAGQLSSPNWQCEIQSVHASRASVVSADIQRHAACAFAVPQRGSYHEIPLEESSRSGIPSCASSVLPPIQPRVARFAESAGVPSYGRTFQPQALIDQSFFAPSPQASARNCPAKSYESLSRRYSFEDSSESDGEPAYRPVPRDETDHSLHPNPLAAHPSRSPPTASGLQAMYSPAASPRPYSGMSNSRTSRNSLQRGTRAPGPERPAGMPWARNSSIQSDAAFLAKRYDDLKPSAPPAMVGAGRKVSSGNDAAQFSSAAYSRRLVSGKIAEEGLAGGRYYV